MKQNQSKMGFANQFANILPEVLTALASMTFFFSLGAFSFVGTMVSAAIMFFGTIAIDYDKYEKGGEQ